MQQHPIPQNVTQYQFRLVGDMTLKQFLELLFGFVLAYLFYSSNLIFIIKWPLAIMSFLLGAGLAFFPIEDRPLDQWITNFIKAIYRPTRFIWKKTNKVPAIFTFEAHPIGPTNTITKTIKAPVLNSNIKIDDNLTQEESTHLSSLDSLFSSLPTAPTAPNGETGTLENRNTNIVFDKPTISVRKLHAPNATTPPPLPAKALASAGPIQATPITPPPNNGSTDIRIDGSMHNQGVLPQTLIFSSTKAPPKPENQSTGTLEKQANKAPLKSIRLPISPKLPNLVVGVATAPDGKLVEGAIVQILDASGLPARAIKTNALGQFATSTPLSPGNYTIEIEADGVSFTPQQLIINNSIISPFEIRANS